MQFGQPVGCLFQPFGGRVGLTVEFLVGFGQLSLKSADRSITFLPASRRVTAYSAAVPWGRARKKARNLIRRSSSIEGFEKESSHPFPVVSVCSPLLFSFQGAEVTLSKVAFG